MIQARVKHAVNWFFKNNEGKWTIFQWPNVLLSSWLILLVVSYLVHSKNFGLLQNAVLFAWAYTELTGGDSYFRKALGAVILVFTVVSFFK